MRALVIDEDAKAKVQRVLDYAVQPEHWYHPGKTQVVPGDDAHFVADLDYGYRCVFTITKHADGFVMRHLSISVPAENKYPNQAAAFTIAQLFGFTGWDERTIASLPDGWMASLNHQEHCVVLAQPYDRAEATA